MTTLYLFRHGETDWNAQERFQGHMDIPLNDKGREQARQIAPVLHQGGIEAILSSDLSRAVETAQIVALGMNIPIFQHPGLREAFLGGAQGLTRAEIESKFGTALVQRWKSSKTTDADISYPGGETGNEVFGRVSRAIQEFLSTHSFNKLGVATHGGVIRRIMQKILPAGSPAVPIPNGVIYQLRYEADTAHFSLI